MLDRPVSSRLSPTAIERCVLQAIADLGEGHGISDVAACAAAGAVSTRIMEAEDAAARHHGGPFQ
mgnify:CR=1 FL=1